MSAPSSSPSASPSSASALHTKWPVAMAAGVVGSLIVGLLVLAFLWPTKTLEAQNLPVSVAGPEQSVTALQKALETASPGTIDLVTATGRDDAVDQIKTRQTYGGIVLGETGQSPEVLTAPAASPAATQLLTGLAGQLQAQLTQQVTASGGDPNTARVTVTPVVPLAESDPTGTGLAAASFPLMMGGLIGGVLISLAVVGVGRRLVALAGLAISTGLVLALVLQTWFGFLQGDFWLTVLGIGLSVLATSAFIVGCSSLLGRAGIAVGAVLTMLIGNPLSAAAIPWQFLAEPWGAIGQYMVPGASNALIRSLSYFPDANNTQQWWVLIGWTALGVVLTVLGHFRSRPAMHVPDASLDEREPEPAQA